MAAFAGDSFATMRKGQLGVRVRRKLARFSHMAQGTRLCPDEVVRRSGRRGMLSSYRLILWRLKDRQQVDCYRL